MPLADDVTDAAEQGNSSDGRREEYLAVERMRSRTCAPRAAVGDLSWYGSGGDRRLGLWRVRLGLGARLDAWDAAGDQQLEQADESEHGEGRAQAGDAGWAFSSTTALAVSLRTPASSSAF
jgi:hypothetical protein